MIALEKNGSLVHQGSWNKQFQLLTDLRGNAQPSLPFTCNAGTLRNITYDNPTLKAYQHLNGERWIEANVDNLTVPGIGSNYESIENNSFFAKIDLNTAKIMKVRIAEIFYQQTHSDQIFDFDPSENTLFGYNMGLELADNMVFILKGRTTYVPADGQGKFESVKTTQIETQILF